MKNQKTHFVILGLLTIEPLTGYEIKKLIEKSIQHFWSESNGQIYPALKSLVTEGFITLKDKQQKGKKVSHLYSITIKGRGELKKWLRETSEQKNLHRDEELLRLFFGKNASEEESIELLKTREKRIKEKLDQYALVQKELKTLTHYPHHLYWSLSLKNGISHAKAELQWCRESIKTLKTQGQS